MPTLHSVEADTIDPVTLLTPRRKITGISAVLLPLLADDSVDWESLEGHVARTLDAGLIPAVNMDTGYGPFLEESERERALDLARTHAGGEFVAAAWVADSSSAPPATMIFCLPYLIASYA